VKDQLPEGWAQARVRDYFDCWGGMTPSTEVEGYWGGRVPWVSSKDVKGWQVAAGTEFVTQRALAETRLRVCRPGSILVVVRSGVLAHTLPVAVATTRVVVNQDLKVLDSGDDSLNHWLALFLRARQRDILNQNRKEGTTVQSIRVEELLNLELPVPPLAEQRRIVEKVEVLLARVNSVRGHQASVRAILRQSRQSVLAAACSGKLTEDWRQSVGSGPAADAGAERPQRRPARSRPGRLWGGGKVPELTDEERASVPVGWTWFKVAELGTQPEDTVQIGPMSMKSSEFAASGVQVLNVGCVQDGWIDTSKCNYLPHEIAVKFKRYSVLRGDVLFTRSGTVGRCAVVEDGHEGFLMTFHLLRVRPNEQRCRAEYLRIALAGTPSIRRQTGEGQIGSTRGGFNTHLLAALDVPVPTLAEQDEIIRRVHRLSAWLATAEHRLERAESYASAVARAVLGKAFAGELVQTEAELSRQEGRTYETTSTMLDRVSRRKEQEVRKSQKERRAIVTS
jgi:type I restriction enzyme, S subunit